MISTVLILNSYIKLTEQQLQVVLLKGLDGAQVPLPLDVEPLAQLRARGPRAVHELLRFQLRGHFAKQVVSTC